MAATFLGSITGTTLNVNSLVSGTIEVGNALYGTGVLQGTFIVSGSGNVWTVNLSQTVTSDGSSLITATAFNNNITPGSPPLLWSEVHDAFTKVNENFDMLIATVGGGSGLTPLNFETLDTNLSPTDTNTYQLGNGLKQWKSVHTAEWSPVLGSELNGLWAGSAQIKGKTDAALRYIIDLPVGSTVDDQLIIDPDKTFFKEIQVNNSLSVVATSFGDTVNLLSGDGISLTVNSSADSIEIDNTGILSITSGQGISTTTTSGVANIVNTGVRSLTNSGAIGTRTPGLGIHVSSSTGTPLLTNTGVLEIQPGSGALAVSTDAITGIVTITNTSPAQPAFQQIEVDGDSANRLVADGTAGVFRIVSGQGITLAKIVGTDTMTITVDPVFDLRGSIFGDDSTKIVDAVENKVFAEFFGNLTGNVTGNVVGNADSATVSTTLDITDTNGLTTVYYPTFVENRTTGQIVRADVDLSYRTDTNTLTAPSFSGNLTGTVTGNIFTNLIDSADSSAITVTPTTIFSSDVTVENDLSVAERLTVKGSRVINLTELKAVVAASSSFADFQTRIAALV
jgi:hypothetical protein